MPMQVINLFLSRAGITLLWQYARVVIFPFDPSPQNSGTAFGQTGAGHGGKGDPEHVPGDAVCP